MALVTLANGHCLFLRYFRNMELALGNHQRSVICLVRVHLVPYLSVQSHERRAGTSASHVATVLQEYGMLLQVLGE